MGREPDAVVADVHAGPGHNPCDLRLWPPAERAASDGSRLPTPAANHARPPSGLVAIDDLVYALVAEAERVGDLPQRGARLVDGEDRIVEARTRLDSLVDRALETSSRVDRLL